MHRLVDYASRVFAIPTLVIMGQGAVYRMIMNSLVNASLAGLEDYVILLSITAEIFVSLCCLWPRVSLVSLIYE